MDEDDAGPSKNGVYLDNTKLISLLIAIVGVAIMGFCSMIYSDEKATAAALQAHIVNAANLAQQYVGKDDMSEINSRLQRIEDKLDQKADKTR